MKKFLGENGETRMPGGQAVFNGNNFFLPFPKILLAYQVRFYI